MENSTGGFSGDGPMVRINLPKNSDNPDDIIKATESGLAMAKRIHDHEKK